MAGVNPTISIILNVNRLNNAIKRQRLSDCIFKNPTIYYILSTGDSRFNDTNRLKVKG